MSANDSDEFIRKSRITRSIPPKPAYDPLKFVQIKPVKLFEPKQPVPEKKPEVRNREAEDAEEWQCNLDSWKSSRRKRVGHIIEKITEAKQIELEEITRTRKKSKTFSEILENSGSRRKFILPSVDNDDNNGADGTEKYDDDDSTPEADVFKEQSDESYDYCTSSSSKLTERSATPEEEEEVIRYEEAYRSAVPVPIPAPASSPAVQGQTPEVNAFTSAIENYKSTIATSQLLSNQKISDEYRQLKRPSLERPSPAVEVNNKNGTNGQSDGRLHQHRPFALAAPKQYSIISDDEESSPVEEERRKSRTSVEESQLNLPKVNVVERRRLFEQLQTLDGGAAVNSIKPGNGHREEPAGTNLEEEEIIERRSGPSSVEAINAGGPTAASIRERRALFEKHQSSDENVAPKIEHTERKSLRDTLFKEFVRQSVQVQEDDDDVTGVLNAEDGSEICEPLPQVGGSDATIVYAVTPDDLNDAECCDDSGIQTTDLSSSVSQNDDQPELNKSDGEEIVNICTEMMSSVSAGEISDSEYADGEEMFNVEQELLQIEREEHKRRRDKQMFYEKLKLDDQEEEDEPPCRPAMASTDCRSLQDVNVYDALLMMPNEGGKVYHQQHHRMTSLHRESMPNLTSSAFNHVVTPAIDYHHHHQSSAAGSATGMTGMEFPAYRQSFGGLTQQGHALLDSRYYGGPDHTTTEHRVQSSGFAEPMGTNAANSEQSYATRAHDTYQVQQTHRFQAPQPHHPQQQPEQQQHQPLQQGVKRNSKEYSQDCSPMYNQRVANRKPTYGQHWLIQEAEQRRIEQHQKHTSAVTAAKKPLPKFVIDAITQRVQQLNASPDVPPEPVSGGGACLLDDVEGNGDGAAFKQQQQQQFSNGGGGINGPTSDKMLSVSGKKECSHCHAELGKGAAMAIESLGLFYHIRCFKCCVCHVKLGDGTNGIDVRVRKYRLHCQNCFSSEDGVKFSCV